jgi:hypothetical protein
MLCTPVISALERQREEDYEFKAHLGYIVKGSKASLSTWQT